MHAPLSNHRPTEDGRQRAPRGRTREPSSSACPAASIDCIALASQTCDIVRPTPAAMKRSAMAASTTSSTSASECGVCPYASPASSAADEGAQRRHRRSDSSSSTGFGRAACALALFSSLAATAHGACRGVSDGSGRRVGWLAGAAAAFFLACRPACCLGGSRSQSAYLQSIIRAHLQASWRRRDHQQEEQE